MITSDPPEPQRHIGNLIRRAQQLHVTTWARVVSDEITSAQYSVLVVLDRLGEASQRELCDEVDLDRSTIAGLLRRLERAGLLVRQRANADARRNVVTLTTDGTAARARLAPLVTEVQRELTAPLSKDETTALYDGLWRMLTRP